MKRGQRACRGASVRCCRRIGFRGGWPLLFRLGRGLHRCALRARVWRGRKFPGGDQGRRGVVPEEGTRVRDRPLQFRHQRRRAPDPAGRAVDHPTWGWYWAFVVTGALGFLWLFVWCRSTARPRRTRASARRSSPTSSSDPPDPADADSVAELLPHRQTWAFALGKFLTDPVWWLYLFWIPDFLFRNYGIDLQHDRSAARRDLPDGRRRQHRRRLAVVGVHQARLERERGTQDGDAGLRACGPADGVRVEGARPVGSRRARSASRPPRIRAGRRISSR